MEQAIKAFGQICHRVFPTNGCTNAERSMHLVESMKQLLDGLNVSHTTRLEGDLDISVGCHV